MTTPRFLHGLHDPGGEALMAARPGWIVFTEAIGADAGDRSGRDYRQWAERGFGVIVRLNHGYGAAGTIPERRGYASFARRAANFIAASPGCERWIIGNEPNHSQERPNGVAIAPEAYAECFETVSLALGDVRPGGGAPEGAWPQLITAAVAPWNVETGDWLEYQQVMLEQIGDLAGGIAVHTYTHGPGVERITSNAGMSPPFMHRAFEFRAYQDILDVIPDRLSDLPVYITETNQGGPWMDRNNGWVQAAYLEIDWWNQTPGTQKVYCLCLYRWSNDDQWGIEDKLGVQADFQAAVGGKYLVPTAEPADGDPAHTLHLPSVGKGAAVADTLPKRVWDARLTERHVHLIAYAPQPGESYWRLIQATYVDEQAAQGRHHIFVDTLDEAGSRLTGVEVTCYWDSGFETKASEAKPGEEAALDFPLFAAGYGYRVRVGDASDRVEGMGLGSIEAPQQGIHVAYRLVFQRTIAPAASPAAPPEKQGGVGSGTPGPGGSPLIDPRVAEAIVAAEAGRPFHEAGRLIIRFEAHVFRSRLPAGDARWAQHFRMGDPAWTGQEWRPAPDAAWRAVHTGRQGDEYAAFELAAGLDPAAAHEAISMGAGQVMGFHYARLGYASAIEMFDAFERSAAAQMLGFVNFVLSDPVLLGAINGREWPVIGARYNGQAEAGEKYRAAYVRLWGG